MKEKLTRAQQFKGAAVAMLAINLSSSFSRIYRLEQKVPVDQIVSDSSLLISCFFLMRLICLFMSGFIYFLIGFLTKYLVILLTEVISKRGKDTDSYIL